MKESVLEILSSAIAGERLFIVPFSVSLCWCNIGISFWPPVLPLPTTENQVELYTPTQSQQLSAFPKYIVWFLLLFIFCFRAEDMKCILTRFGSFVNLQNSVNRIYHPPGCSVGVEPAPYSTS